MRFAYIDSHGNEISIPSVDALALRIELGAILADTELHDAQADRWGPAHTHDIFHTLSRDAGEEGFVAPPPAMAQQPPATESPSAEGAESEADAGLDDLDFSLADAGGTDFGEVGSDPAPEVADEPSGDGADEEDGGFDLGDFSGLIEEELSVQAEFGIGNRVGRTWVVEWTCRWTCQVAECGWAADGLRGRGRYRDLGRRDRARTASVGLHA